MMNADKILDYDKLVETYSNNLDVTLRGFRPAEEMLDTWVPDDNPISSLSNLVEAAQLCGSNSVAVRIGRKNLEPESTASVRDKLASQGEVEVIEKDDSVTFTVTKLQETAAFRSVRPIYQQKLRERAASLHFKRPIKAGENQISLRATEEHFSLSWSVQADKHVIADASFDAAKTGPMAAALDCLCEILVGLPVQEARDHAVIRLEFALRATGQRHPVSGIVLPQNADATFRLPATLVNRLFEDYCNSSGFKPQMNFFDPGPKQGWRALSPEERAQRVTAAVAAHRGELDVEEGDVHIVECKFPYAVTVQFADRLTIPAKRKIALALERLVRKECDPRLEVFCEEKKDLSKLRRLIDTEEKAK